MIDPIELASEFFEELTTIDTRIVQRAARERCLGRRVYVGAIVVLASAVALAVATVSVGVRATGVPARTTRRWIGWWRGPFTTSRPFVDSRRVLCPRPGQSDARLALLADACEAAHLDAELALTQLAGHQRLIAGGGEQVVEALREAKLEPKVVMEPTGTRTRP